MPVPTSLATLSQTPGSNSPAGSDAVFPSLDDYLREMFADFARLRDGANTWLTGVSGTNTITATCTSINALVAGQVFRFVASANTGAVTLNINGLGAKAVTRPGAVALVTGDMPTFAEVGYNGATFELLNSNHVALADAATSATTATTASAAPWSGITGKPTTTAGYGITDALSTADLASSAEVIAGLDALKPITPQTLRAGAIVSSTAVATTSGTAVNISTAIPSWARRITINLRGVSTNGSDTPLIQVGAGSFATSGYLSTSAGIIAAVGFSNVNATNGFIVNGGLSSDAISGHLVLTNMGGNNWVASGVMKMEPAVMVMLAGDVSLGGALDRVRITTSGGASTFDAGSASVTWE